MSTTARNTNFLNGFYGSWRWGCLKLFENSRHGGSHSTRLLIYCMSTDIAKIISERSKPDKHGHENGKECTRAGKMLSKTIQGIKYKLAEYYITKRSHWPIPTRRMPHWNEESTQGQGFYTKSFPKEAQRVKSRIATLAIRVITQLIQWYLAFGRHLEEIHVTWAHLEKKRTRLRTNTKTLQASKSRKAANNHDPLALLAHSNASSSQSHANSFYSPQIYYVTHSSSVADYENEYQGELQEDSQEDKVTTTMMMVELTYKPRMQVMVEMRVPRTESTSRKANVQCYNCNEKGHYVHDCQKPRVHDAKYFREQMLLAMKDEAESNLKDEENDFMLDSSYGDETLEELIVAVIMMARIQPADDNADSEPSYDAKLAKKAFKERENRYLDDIIDLEEKLSSHDRIVYKMAGLGYKNPERLKKAIAAQPKMYHGEMLHSTNLKIDSPNSEETLEDAEESRLK
ncbi:retrovirus-related pol polyprotein from transposon TNT 1-94 [Tanacetum coccineum]